MAISFLQYITAPGLTLSSLSTGTLINTSGVVSALSGTNLVLGNGTTLAQSTFQTSNTQLSNFASLGSPGTSGWVLSSTSGGVLSWVAAGGGGGMTNPMTTTGDIIYASSGSTPARLGIGATGTILIGGTTPSWSANLTLGGKLTLPASITGSAYFNIPQGVAPTTPVTGDVWITSSGYFAQIAGATVKLNTNGALYYSSSSVLIIDNTTTLTTVLSTTLPSSAQSPGNIINIKGDGVISYNSLSDTITITILLGSTTLCTFNIAGTSIPGGATGTNYHWTFDARLSPQTAIGASATVGLYGTFTVIGTNASFVTDIQVSGTVNTTISNNLNINAQWSSAASGNTLTTNLLVAQQINSTGGAGGSVISVGLSTPSLFTVSGSPITSSGNLSFAWNGSANNFVLADGSTIPKINKYSTTIDFGNEQNEAFTVVSDTSLTSSSVYTVEHSQEELALQGVNFYVTSLTVGVGYTIVGIAPNGASGVYPITSIKIIP